MTEEDNLYIRLKYDVITLDRSTWDACKTYPTDVLSKWAWRCVEDVIHLGLDNHEVCMLYYVAKKYKNNKASHRDLKDAYGNVWSLGGELFDDMIYHAVLLDNIDYWAPRCVHFAVRIRATLDHWVIYLAWLVEELYIFESEKCQEKLLKKES